MRTPQSRLQRLLLSVGLLAVVGIALERNCLSAQVLKLPGRNAASRDLAAAAAARDLDAEVLRRFDLDGDGENTYGDRYALLYWLRLGGSANQVSAAGERRTDGLLDLAEFFAGPDSRIKSVRAIQELEPGKVVAEFGPGQQLIGPQLLAGDGAVAGGGCGSACFTRGDSNADCNVDLSDANHTMSHLFSGQSLAGNSDAADFNDDGSINISDPIGTLNYLFQGGPPGAEPFLDAPGEDPTPDDNPAPPESGHCGSDDPSDSSAEDELCTTFYAGPAPPEVGLTDCAGTKPAGLPSTDESDPQPVHPDTPDASMQPKPKKGQRTAVVGITGTPWEGGATEPASPTSQATAATFRGPVQPADLATNLYDEGPSPARDGMSILERAKTGSVEISHLGLVWGEVDATYRGVNGELPLVVGRRYFSRSLIDSQGTVGDRWVHSFYERLESVSGNKYRHVSWNHP